MEFVGLGTCSRMLLEWIGDSVTGDWEAVLATLFKS